MLQGLAELFCLLNPDQHLSIKPEKGKGQCYATHTPKKSSGGFMIRDLKPQNNNLLTKGRQTFQD